MNFLDTQVVKEVEQLSSFWSLVRERADQGWDLVCSHPEKLSEPDYEILYFLAGMLRGYEWLQLEQTLARALTELQWARTDQVAAYIQTALAEVEAVEGVVV